MGGTGQRRYQGVIEGVRSGRARLLQRQYGCTPLHEAAVKGHAEAARALMEAGADKEAKNKVGYGSARR
eukprot:1861219-Rhodomonas_salina.1